MNDDSVAGATGLEGAGGRIPATLPSAETVMAYEKAVPGATERILNMVERTMEHHIRSVEDDRAHHRALARQGHVRGMWSLVFGFLVAAMAVVFGSTIAYLEEPVIGAVIAVGVPIVILAAFAIAQRARRSS
ncbi:MAG: hypothetical protein GAK28_00966 [Luteibacter sp.]|uniref:DUF2335 domain-containing protein n=1 Tax=Luteibacter sp. TaxID=1886636 RepID=UPI001385F89A|nr:DUF2335 domain-containing protein [Luteibacter sp.]KAF1008544.1 MAG: hypothetical protein GAK28_00966 [Luteibacter sp.]